MYSPKRATNGQRKFLVHHTWQIKLILMMNGWFCSKWRGNAAGLSPHFSSNDESWTAEGGEQGHCGAARVSLVSLSLLTDGWSSGSTCEGVPGADAAATASFLPLTLLSLNNTHLFFSHIFYQALNASLKTSQCNSYSSQWIACVAGYALLFMFVNKFHSYSLKSTLY